MVDKRLIQALALESNIRLPCKKLSTSSTSFENAIALDSQKGRLNLSKKSKKLRNMKLPTKDVVLVRPSGSTVRTWASVPVGTRYSDLLREVPSLPVDYRVLRGTDTVHPPLRTSPKTISFAELAQVTLTLVVPDRSFVVVLMVGIPIDNEHIFYELPELACRVEVGPHDIKIKAAGVLTEMAKRSETGGPLARRMCGDLKRLARSPWAKRRDLIEMCRYELSRNGIATIYVLVLDGELVIRRRMGEVSSKVRGEDSVILHSRLAALYDGE